MSKLCKSGGKYIPLVECPHCKTPKSEITGQFANHVKECNPDKILYKNTKGSKYAVGRVGWNTGLTAETSGIIKSSAETLKSRYATGELVPTGCFAMSTADRSAKAKKQGLGGYQPNAGHSKKFKVIDSFGKETVLQSTYELECATLLNDMGIQWNRPRAMKYGSKNYFADFYLPDYNVYLDPKNSYKAKLDANKIAAVIAENNVKLYVLLKEQITRDYIEKLMAIRPNGEVAS